MSNEKVINYRNVHKSDHLGVVDLEEAAENGTRPIVTIDYVEQFANSNKVTVAGREINANIAHFVEDIKPLVVNATNGAILKGFADSVDIRKWSGLTIELYADKNVQMKGQTVGGVRIKPTQPVVTMPSLTPSHPKWNDAKNAVKNNGATFESINKNYLLTQENWELLCK